CAGVHILPLNHAQNLLKTYHSEFPKGLYVLWELRVNGLKYPTFIHCELNFYPAIFPSHSI
ncbi:hypothetical protein, partial [Acetobacter cerevisiae]